MIMTPATMRPTTTILGMGFVLLLVLPTLVGAQESAAAPAATRAESQRRAREEKQRTLEAYQPNALERTLDIVEGRLVPLLARDGIHWKLGSLTSGSGFAYGGGFRHRRLFNREGAAGVWAAASLKKYWALEGRFELPDIGRGRAMFAAYARRHSYPQEDFFGIGPASRRADETSFRLGNTLIGARAGVRPAAIVTVGAGLEYLRPRLGEGRNDAVPSIEARFDATAAPGLGGTHDFLRTTLFADVDYRRPKNARRGGWYRLDFNRYHEDTGAFSFQRVDVDLRQYASVLAERRVLAVRLFASTSTPEAGAAVPFYLLPVLGGHDTLRGFRDARFRGPHAILTQTEYRWEVWSGFDAALFYDAGKVTNSRGDLSFRDLERAYGFGFRFNTDQGAILRIDAGFGSRDGKHLYIVFGDVF